ncbi:MAG: hypothetical protein ACYDB0_08335 [Acidithiobacillus sp.]
MLCRRDKEDRPYLPVPARSEEEVSVVAGITPGEDAFQRWLASIQRARQEQRLYFVRFDKSQDARTPHRMLFLPGADAPFTMLTYPDDDVKVGIQPAYSYAAFRDLHRWFPVALWKSCLLVNDPEFGFPEILMQSDAPFVEIRVGLGDAVVNDLRRILGGGLDNIVQYRLA